MASSAESIEWWNNLNPNYPSQLILTPQVEQGSSKFMFAIKADSYKFRIDLNDHSIRYFNICMFQKSRKNGKPDQKKEIKLVPCTLQHWPNVP